MSADATAYLVLRREDGFGDVFPLEAAHHYTIGRINTNRIVLKDELCSREHAHVFHGDGHWLVRDNESLNGTRVNGERLERERELVPGDDIHLGRTHLIFVRELAQLPEMPVPPPREDSVSIKKRVGNTRYLTPIPVSHHAEAAETAMLNEDGQRLSKNLALLYRLALDMGSAPNAAELAKKVLDALLQATPSADAGAIQLVKDAGKLELTAQKNRDERAAMAAKISRFVSEEVMESREAILAEDVASDEHLRSRDSITDLRAASLICAPAVFNQRVLALIHLYSTDQRRPLDPEDLEFALAVAQQFGGALHHLQRQASLTNENRSLRSQLKVESELVGTSPSMRVIEEQIGRVADTTATVLIRGESGTGKELVARAIHYNSPRRDGPFVCLNCAALPETLLESELFGHEKGSFTGATEKKIGKFEAANHGTIFLDEIGEMNPSTQAKLLRVLEGHPFERLGGHAPIHVDVRVVSATNSPLEQAIKDGNFRKDLFYRLQVVEIRLPPLRERPGDVRQLVEHFLKRYVGETGRKIQGFTPEAVEKLERYSWPGNVRELRNVIERSVALGFGPLLDAKDLWLSNLEAGSPGPAAEGDANVYSPLDLAEVEKQHILRTLQHTNWNKSQAASILKIERSTLDRKIKGYKLQR